MNQPRRWVIEEPGYGRLPHVSVDLTGRWWVVWVSWSKDGECVKASWREPGGEWSNPVQVSDYRPGVTSLAVAPWNNGILLAWCDIGNPDTDGAKIRAFQPSGGQDVQLVVPARRAPTHLSVDTHQGRCVLAWTVRKIGGRSIMACYGTDPTALSSAIEFSENGMSNMRPTVVSQENGTLIVWESMGRGISSILARHMTADGSMSRVIQVEIDTEATCTMATATGGLDGGCWIGWQSDRDPLTGPGLVRWINVVHLSGDLTVHTTSALMSGRDYQGQGENQGFESASLAQLDDGRLVVVGRGSQSIRRQDLGAAGWTDPSQIDEPGWQCRGRRFEICAVENGLLAVGREQDGIVVRLLEQGNDATGGRPILDPIESTKATLKEQTTDTGHRHIIAGKRVLYGDIHQHTSASDGTGTIEETCFRARYRYRDDIVAVADHESFLGKQTSPGEWAEGCRVADEFCEPGTFVTLHATEWTGKMHPGPGHKVIYLPPEGGPVLSRENESTSTAAGLVAECGKRGALAFPHHVGWTGANMDDHDPEVQTCFEIVSCHGAYERHGAGPILTRGDDKEGQFAADALDAGLRFGFVGGSDGHGLNWHHGVCRIQDSHRTGLTAVFSKEVSRKGVFSALKRRLCYATSGAKIGLWFEVDGRPMGEELVIGGSVAFRVVVAATDSIKSLALVSNGGQITELEASGTEADVRGMLPPPPESGWCYYFVKVVQVDDEVAWSSPIWLDAPNPA